MKKIILCAVIMMVSVAASAQFVNGGGASTKKSSSRGSSGGGLYTSGDGPRYSTLFNFGTTFADNLGGVSLDCVNGCAIRDFIFTGFGVGIHTLFNTAYNYSYVSFPFYADIKGNLRFNETMSMFFDFGIGVFVGGEYYKNERWLVGCYAHIGPGFQYKNFTAGIGYEFNGWDSGYIRLGYCL